MQNHKMFLETLSGLRRDLKEHPDFITRAEDERTILDKDSTIWQSTLPTSSVAQQALVLPNGATMPPTVWAQHSTGR